MENKIYVAVGKRVEERISTLNWALKFARGVTICLIHVHVPAQIISQSNDSESPVSSFREASVKALQAFERKEVIKMLDDCLQICDLQQVPSEKLYVENESVSDGIVELISQLRIQKLVMGVGADSLYSREKPLSEKAKYVLQRAPDFCHIWFVCKDQLFYTREGVKQPSLDVEGLTSNDSKRDEPDAGTSSQALSFRLRLSNFSGYEGSSNGFDQSSRVTVMLSSTYSPETASAFSSPPLSLTREVRESGLELLTLPQTKNNHQDLSPPIVMEESSMKDAECDQLEQAMAEVENSKLEAFEESIQKPEEEALLATHMVKAAQRLYFKELRQRKEMEEELAERKKELEVTKTLLTLVSRELHEAMGHKLSLESQLDKFCLSEKEMEEKLLSAVDLLQKFKNERDELYVERDNLLHEAEELRKRLAQRPSSSHVPIFFSDFSFSDIEKATNYFDSSLKIGEGGNGIMYKGFLHQTEVTIEMLKDKTIHDAQKLDQKMKATGIVLNEVEKDHKDTKYELHEVMQMLREIEDMILSSRKTEECKLKKIMEEHIFFMVNLQKYKKHCDILYIEHEDLLNQAKNSLKDPTIEQQELSKMLLKLKDNLLSQKQTEKHKLKKIIEHNSCMLKLLEYKKQCNTLHVEHDELRKQVAGVPSSSLVPKFSCEFSHLDLEEATECFDTLLRIREGGCGGVCKVFLYYTEVAMKTLEPHLHGMMEFKQKVNALSKLRHPNLVNLIGACLDSSALIYEHLPNGNLEDRLNCKYNTPPLPWQTRIRIITELCSVLNFLHSSRPCSIIHGDLNPKSVLLDANYSCKLRLGFCHILSSNRQTLTTELKGTSSYIDPQFLEEGNLSPKSDVYSFGKILLCLLTGRPALKIVEEVQHALWNDNLHSILDSSAGDWPVVRARHLAYMALKCCDVKAEDRPDLGSEVWSVLKPIMTSSESLSSPLQVVSGDQVPSYFVCPIFQEIMLDPHFAADGFTYEADAVRGWFEGGHDTSPMTNLKLDNQDLTPNRSLRSAIQEWLQKHQHV